MLGKKSVAKKHMQSLMESQLKKFRWTRIVRPKYIKIYAHEMFGQEAKEKNREHFPLSPVVFWLPWEHVGTYKSI